MKLYDDYEWETYTSKYKEQYDENREVDVLLKHTSIENGKIIYRENTHENIRTIYDLVLNTNVKSVFECGCGGGQHLYNIKFLIPNIKVAGCDLLETQIDFGRKTFNVPDETYENVYICDGTEPNVFSDMNEKFEFVFTHTVLQHLNHAKAIEMIRNICSISSKYVFMLENRNNHIFEDLFNQSGVLTEFEYSLHQGLVQGMLLTKKI